MQDFEKLGAFYLGKRCEQADSDPTGELVLYDSADLTTHAVIVGMTGSGKTGLGVGLIEEAALDRIPVIAIDPKGDLGNLLLSFPELRAEDFAPWVDPRAASEQGHSVEAFAAAVAETWKQGLADWGQAPERIGRLREAADFALYTPGSSAGTPLAVLGHFAPPPDSLRSDAELVGERISSTVDGLLALLGIESDPITGPEHILLSRIFHARWSEGQGFDLAALIGMIQTPPFDKLGVMDLESFYPAKRRFELAMRLNGLLAAPGFDVWMQGEPLAAANLLHNAAGKPRVSVVSIAHLDDAQRLFFVTLLLGELIAWMRQQPGSSSLRAILYMDEIAGFLPPVANPPTKSLFLTLLKQARAFGLGLVLSTQNPVDLDYKALSNAGTWFVGRLQTERDRNRLREGLLSAAGSGLDTGWLDRTLAALGKRRFLLHNVHEREPVVFATRWVMSYLAGPLTRNQIRRLSAVPASSVQPASPAAAASVATAAPTAEPATEPAAGADAYTKNPPVVPPDVKQCFVPATAGARLYRPTLLVAVTAYYANARAKVDRRVESVLNVSISPDDLTIDWDAAHKLPIESGALAREATPGLAFAGVPALLTNAGKQRTWESSFKRWFRSNRPLRILHCAALKLYSEPGEAEGEFRARLQHAANENRDVNVAKLRKSYETKVARVESRLLTAKQALERESEQARGAKLDTALSVGTAVLGALLGRKRISVTSVNRGSTAIRKAGSASKQAGDVRRARERIAALEAQMQELADAFDSDIAALDAAFDAQTEPLTETLIKPKATDIEVLFLGIGWVPAAG